MSEIQTEYDYDDMDIYFAPRSIGLNWIPCFICGFDKKTAQPDMASFVKDKKSGEIVVQWFKEILGHKIKLDYRPREPHWSM